MCGGGGWRRDGWYHGGGGLVGTTVEEGWLVPRWGKGGCYHGGGRVVGTTVSEKNVTDCLAMFVMICSVDNAVISHTGVSVGCAVRSRGV